MSHQALKDALAKFGNNQSKFAAALGTSQQRISYLLARGNSLPAELVIACERETGVSRHRLRPDIYPPEAPAQGAAA